LFYPTNDPTISSNWFQASKLDKTNGTSYGQIATNLDIQGDVGFGPQGASTNVVTGKTNYIAFYGAGTSLATNGALIWASSQNCYTNWLNGEILTNTGSAWLLQTNGVTLYSISGSSPVGTYSAVSGSAPPPTAVYTAALNDHFVFLGYWSISNQNAISNSIVTNVVQITTNNFIANSNGLGTNGTLYTFHFEWDSAAPGKNLANNLLGAQLNFGTAAFGQANTNISGSDFGAAIRSGTTNRIVTGGAEVIAGGAYNVINGSSGNGDVIGGGYCNTINSVVGISGIDASGIGGGISNKMAGISSVIGGGFDNQLTGNYAVNLGGLANTNIADGSAILGGYSNRVTGANSTTVGRNVTITHSDVFSWSGGPADASVTNSQARISGTNGLYVNGAIWTAPINTNSGVYFRSNQFNVFAATNGLATGDFAHINSNGFPVQVWISNGTPVFKNLWP